MEGETVLITGASSGIGLELTKLFAAHKSNLVLVARSQDKLELLAESLRNKEGIKVEIIPQDLSNPSAPIDLFDQLNQRNIVVDIVVNNAGFGSVGSVAALGSEKQLKMIQVNVVSLMHLARLFLPGMIERRRGGILNVGSTAGFQPGPNMAVYYATKAFVLSFTEALAEELSHTGITVTCLLPGPTATGFGADSGMEKTLIFKFGQMSASLAAQIGYRGFRKGKTIVIPGIKNKLHAFLIRFIPRSLARKMVKSAQR